MEGKFIRTIAHAVKPMTDEYGNVILFSNRTLVRGLDCFQIIISDRNRCNKGDDNEETQCDGGTVLKTKRLLLMLISVSLILSLCSCTSKSEPSDTASVPQAEEQTDVDRETSEVNTDIIMEPEELIPEEFQGYTIPEIDYADLGSFIAYGPGVKDEECGQYEDTEEDFRARSAEEQYHYAELFQQSEDGYWDRLSILYHYIDAADKGCTAALTGAARNYYYSRPDDGWLTGCYYWSSKAIESGEVGEAQFLLGYCYNSLGEEYQDTAENLFVTAFDNGNKNAAYFLSELYSARGEYSEAAKYTREFIEGVCEENPDATYTNWFGRLPEEDVKAYAGIWYNDSRTCIQLFSNGFFEFISSDPKYSEYERTYHEERAGKELPKLNQIGDCGSWWVENGFAVLDLPYDVDNFCPTDYWYNRYYFEKNGDRLVFHHAESWYNRYGEYKNEDSAIYGPDQCLDTTDFRKVSPATDDGYSGLYMYFWEFGWECRDVHISCVDGVYQSHLWINNRMNGWDEYAYVAEDGSYMTLSESDYGGTYRFSRFDDHFYQLNPKPTEESDDPSVDYVPESWPLLTKVASFW